MEGSGGMWGKNKPVRGGDGKCGKNKPHNMGGGGRWGDKNREEKAIKSHHDLHVSFIQICYLFLYSVTCFLLTLYFLKFLN